MGNIIGKIRFKGSIINRVRFIAYKVKIRVLVVLILVLILVKLFLKK